jgi:formyltetrahydrofolate-dependent phosphoribosylglycinamide formyltransferase
LRLGVIFSGGGRTLENLAERIRDGSLPATIVVAISSHQEAGGNDRARRQNIPLKVIDYREAGTSFSEKITAALDEANVELVILAGLVRLYRFPERYAGRILNIHPALLPAFGGKGYYGDRVHAAVLDSDRKFSGCTVHLVTEEYDRGPIILQRFVPVSPTDNPKTLAERVFAEERIAYPEAIRLCAEGKLEMDGNRVLVKSAAGSPA